MLLMTWRGGGPCSDELEYTGHRCNGEKKGSKVVTCPHCGFVNPDEAKLCVRCSLPLSVEEEGGGQEKDSTRMLENTPYHPSVPRWGTASLGGARKLLLHVRGYDTPLVVPLAERLIIGRYDTETGKTPDISLDEYGAREQGVSRQHAMIVWGADGLKVMDLGSANHTFINGQRLIMHQARILRDGDELRLGRLVIRVHFA